VVDSDLTEGDKLFLINIVETYLPRQAVFDAREEVMQALNDVEMTWFEKATQQARQEAHQQGRQEGIRTLLVLLLTWKFGALPPEFVDKLNAITDPTTLTEISQQVLTAQSLAEIKRPSAP
jgi:hypothetical protein